MSGIFGWIVIAENNNARDIDGVADHLESLGIAFAHNSRFNESAYCGTSEL